MKRLLKDKHKKPFELLSIGFANSKFFPILTMFRDSDFNYYYLFNKFLICKVEK